MKSSIPAILLFATLSACNNATETKTTEENTAPAEVKNETVQDSVCYLNVTGRDSLFIQLTENNGKVSGKMRFDNHEKDGSFGVFNGVRENDVIRGFYTMQSEGMISSAEYYMKAENNAIIIGIADDLTFNKTNDTSYIKNPQNIQYTGQRAEKTDCDGIRSQLDFDAQYF